MRGVIVMADDPKGVLDFNDATPFQSAEDLRAQNKAERDEIHRRLQQNIKTVLKGLYGDALLECGNHVRLGDIYGDPGESLKIEIKPFDKAGLWHEKNGNEGGNIFDLIRAKRGCADWPQVIEEAKVLLGDAPPTKRTVQSKRDQKKREAKPRKSKGIMLDQIDYDYDSPDGTPILRVRRFQYENGKDFAQATCIDGAWHNKGPKIKPLFNLPNIIGAETIIFVEGEKAAQALIDLKYAATCVPSGSSTRPRECDLSHIAGKNVIIWEDNDSPGKDFADAFQVAFQALCKDVKRVVIPEGKPDKWDAADATAEEIEALLDSSEPAKPLRRDGALKQSEGAMKQDKYLRAELLLHNGGLSEAAETLDSAMSASGNHFLKDNRPHTIVPYEAKNADETVSRWKMVCAMDMTAIQAAADDLFECKRFDARKKDWTVRDAPKSLAERLLALCRSGQSALPLIRGVTETPILTGNGTVWTTPGYHAPSALYFASELQFQIPDQPSRQDAEAALQHLQELLSGFDPIDGASEAVLLSAIMSAVLRWHVRAPLHAISAPVYGSGKSTACRLAGILATGSAAPVLDRGSARDPSELGKRLDGLLLTCPPIVVIDNCNGELAGEALAQILTEDAVNVRPLGASEVVRIDSFPIMLANGNNVEIAQDIVRRSILCRLDPNCERPDARQFDFDPIERAKICRADYVSDIFTIALWWGQNRHDLQLEATDDQFGTWCRHVREPLVALGCDDPLATQDALRADDPETALLHRFVKTWPFGDAWQSAKDMLRTSSHAFMDALDDIPHKPNTEISSHALGKWLTRFDGRTIGGKKIVKQVYQGTSQFKVIQANG